MATEKGSKGHDKNSTFKVLGSVRDESKAMFEAQGINLNTAIGAYVIRTAACGAIPIEAKARRWGLYDGIGTDGSNGEPSNATLRMERRDKKRPLEFCKLIGATPSNLAHMHLVQIANELRVLEWL